MTTHAMIDIETLATTPEAVVLSVGGVKFDPYTNQEPHSFLDFKLDIDEFSDRSWVIPGRLRFYKDLQAFWLSLVSSLL